MEKRTTITAELRQSLYRHCPGRHHRCRTPLVSEIGKSATSRTHPDNGGTGHPLGPIPVGSRSPPCQLCIIWKLSNSRLRGFIGRLSLFEDTELHQPFHVQKEITNECRGWPWRSVESFGSDSGTLADDEIVVGHLEQTRFPRSLP